MGMGDRVLEHPTAPPPEHLPHQGLELLPGELAHRAETGLLVQKPSLLPRQDPGDETGRQKDQQTPSRKGTRNPVRENLIADDTVACDYRKRISNP